MFETSSVPAIGDLCWSSGRLAGVRCDEPEELRGFVSVAGGVAYLPLDLERSCLLLGLKKVLAKLMEKHWEHNTIITIYIYIYI